MWNPPEEYHPDADVCHVCGRVELCNSLGDDVLCESCWEDIVGPELIVEEPEVGDAENG